VKKDGGKISSTDTQLISIRKLRMGNYWFSIQKRGIFRPGKKLLLAKVDSEGCPEGEPSGRVIIKELRGGVHRYAAQASPLIDTARAEKNRFRLKTS
jgi:hypothetical protein